MTDNAVVQLLRFIPSASLCEDALLEAVEIMEDRVAVTLSLPQPPTAGMQQASMWEPLKRLTAVCYYMEPGVSEAMLGFRGLTLTVQDFDMQGEPLSPVSCGPTSMKNLLSPLPEAFGSST